MVLRESSTSTARRFVSRPDQPNQEPERAARVIDHGTNVTFVMYPKADSSRIVKRQGGEPRLDLKTGFDRHLEHR